MCNILAPSTHPHERGDHREPIFKDEQDRERFLAIRGEVCARTSWHVQAFYPVVLFGYRRHGPTVPRPEYCIYCNNYIFDLRLNRCRRYGLQHDGFLPLPAKTDEGGVRLGQRN